MRVAQLSEDEITDHLQRLPGWTRQGEAITKTYAFADFSRAMDFVNQVAETAESVNHHPDIDIRYHKVTLSLTTHDSGGLTRNDVSLAAACDDFADAVGGPALA
jgi:4a-hydroxytetrahydrobiopterin dehydratase